MTNMYHTLSFGGDCQVASFVEDLLKFAIISSVRGNKWCVFKRPESYDFLISKNVLVVMLVLEKKWTLYTFGQTYRKHTAGDQKIE